MKFFVVTLLAQRVVSDGVEAGVNTLLMLQDTEQDARRVAEQEIVTLFPGANGWGNYQMSVNEIPPTFEDNGHRFTWKTEPIHESRVRRERRR